MRARLPIRSTGGRVPEPQNPSPTTPDPPLEAQFATLFVPEYAAPLTAELTQNQRLIAKLATWFGALPLTLGVLDFLLWIPTREKVFELGGLLIILLGLFCTFIGGLLLLIQLCSIRGSGKLRLFFVTSR